MLIFIILNSCQAGAEACLSKTKILHYLLEGTAASNVESVEEKEKDAADASPYGNSAGGMFSNIPFTSKFSLC